MTALEKVLNTPGVKTRAQVKKIKEAMSNFSRGMFQNDYDNLEGQGPSWYMRAGEVISGKKE